MTATRFAPGDLVFARGREWVALPAPADDLLCLRPLSGAEADVQVIHRVASLSLICVKPNRTCWMPVVRVALTGLRLAAGRH